MQNNEPATMKIDRQKIAALARSVIENEAAAVAGMAAQLDDSIYPALETIFNCRGHILVTGSGTSRSVAARFAHLLSCCGTPALFISATDALHGGAGAIKPEDVVYIISKGGQSEEINQFARLAKGRGAKVVAHTEKPGSPLGLLSDAVYHVVTKGDVDPYGMIATGSSLVNSAACDALCVLLLEARGYTRDDFGKTHPGGAVGKKLAGDAA
jgi:arabinose-5-phosphate isomerase